MNVFELQASISLQTSEFVSAIKQAVQQANSMKDAMDKMQNPLSTNQKQIGQLSDNLKEAEKNLENAKNQTKEAASNVDKLSDELEKSTELTGENSDETKRLAEELENAKSYLEECEEAERSLSDQVDACSSALEDAASSADTLSDSADGVTESSDEAGSSVSGLGDSASDASSKFESLIGTLENVGSTVTNIVGTITQGCLAITGAVASATTGSMAAVVGGTAQLAAYGDQIDKQSQKIGISAQAYQEWDAIMQHSGSSVGSMIASMRTLTNAAQGDSDALKALGISQKEALSMGQEELFSAVITKLQNMEDKAQRTYLATKLLGRGAMEFGALLNTSAEDTQKMRDRVHELGGVLTDVAVKDAARFQDMLQDVKTGISGLSNNLLSQFLPSMATVMEGVTDILAGDDGAKKISDGLDDIKKNFDNAFDNIMEIVDRFAPAIEKLVPIVSDIFNKISMSMIDSVLNVDVEAAIDKAVNWFNSGFDNIKSIFSRMPDIITRGLEIISDSKTISSAIGFFESVGTSIADTFLSALTKLPSLIDTVVPYLNDLLGDVIGWIVDNVPKIVDSVIDTADSLLDGIFSIAESLFTTENMKKLFTGILDIVGKLGDFIGKNVGGLIDAAVAIIDALTESFYSPEVVSKIFDTAASLVRSLVDGLTGGNHLQKLLDAALNITLMMQKVFMEPEVIESVTEAAAIIVSELAKGILQSLPQIANSLAGFAKNVVDFIINYDWSAAADGFVSGFMSGFDSMDWSFLDNVEQKWVDFWDSIVNYWRPVYDEWVGFWEGFGEYLYDAIHKIINSIVNFFSEIWNNYLDFWGNIGGKLYDVIEKITAKLDQWWSDIAMKTANGVSDVLAWFQNIPDKLSQIASDAWKWGTDMLQNFIDGIKARIPNLDGVVHSVAQTISNILGHSHPKEGPLAKDYTWMPDMMQLFADGIRTNAGKVESEITSLAESMRPGLDYTATVSAGYGSVSQYSAYTGATGAGVSPSLETIVNLLNGILVATQEGHYVSVTDIDTSLGRRQAAEIRRGI